MIKSVWGALPPLDASWRQLGARPPSPRPPSPNPCVGKQLELHVCARFGVSRPAPRSRPIAETTISAQTSSGPVGPGRAFWLGRSTPTPTTTAAPAPMTAATTAAPAPMTGATTHCACTYDCSYDTLRLHLWLQLRHTAPTSTTTPALPAPPFAPQVWQFTPVCASPSVAVLAQDAPWAIGSPQSLSALPYSHAACLRHPQSVRAPGALTDACKSPWGS